MLIKNSSKIVIKLGSSTVVDGKGRFKKIWVTSLIKDIKRFKTKYREWYNGCHEMLRISPYELLRFVLSFNKCDRFGRA